LDWHSVFDLRHLVWTGGDNLEHVQRRTGQTGRKYKQQSSPKTGIESRPECIVASREKRKMREVSTA